MACSNNPALIECLLLEILQEEEAIVSLQSLIGGGASEPF
jgi:hypothetical protein